MSDSKQTRKKVIAFENFRCLMFLSGFLYFFDITPLVLVFSGVCVGINSWI